MNCFYCSQRLGNFSPRYQVRKAVKPKGAPYRWSVVGEMCESCESKGLKASYDHFTKDKK